MASGIFEKELKRIGETVAIRGSGRQIKAEFWKQLGEMYPIKVGWESYPIYKALSLGYEIQEFTHTYMDLQRPKGKRTDYFAYKI